MRIPALLIYSFFVLLLPGCEKEELYPLPAEELDVMWVPTPSEVIEVMLDLAEIGPGDVVYDLGCGEGEVLIAAAKRGARGVGVDIDPFRIRNARINARQAGVADRIEFRVQDLFETDISEATAVTLYLLPEINERLRPVFMKSLKPGTAVVSHDFGIGNWEPLRTEFVSLDRLHPVYMWRIPEQ